MAVLTGEPVMLLPADAAADLADVAPAAGMTLAQAAMDAVVRREHGLPETPRRKPVASRPVDDVHWPVAMQLRM